MGNSAEPLATTASWFSVDNKVARCLIKVDMTITGEVPGAQNRFNLQRQGVRHRIWNASCDLLPFFRMFLILQQRLLALLQLARPLMEINRLLHTGALLYQ